MRFIEATDASKGIIWSPQIMFYLSSEQVRNLIQI